MINWLKDKIDTYQIRKYLDSKYKIKQIVVNNHRDKMRITKRRNNDITKEFT